MLLLTTTDKLALVTDAAATVDAYAAFVDYLSGVATPVAPQMTAITTATTTDIVAVPAASTIRNVKTLHIRNKHATTPVTITLNLNRSATLYELYKVVLNPGDSLEYAEGVGFYLLAVARLLGITLAGDQSNSTVTPAEVTGLTIPLGVGTWAFRYDILYQTAATTTGIRNSVDFTGTVTSFPYNIFWVDNNAAGASAPSQAFVTGGGAVLAGLSARAKSQAGITTAGVDTINADMFQVIEGLAVVTVAGNLALWSGSEVAASNTTVKAGSKLRVG